MAMSPGLVGIVALVCVMTVVIPTTTTTLVVLAADGCTSPTRESCFDAVASYACQWCPTNVAANRAGFCQPLGSPCDTFISLDSCPSSTTNTSCITNGMQCGWCSLPSAAPGGRQCLFTTSGTRPSQCVNGTWTQPLSACSQYTVQGSANCRSQLYCGWCGASSTCLWSDGPQPSDCASGWDFAAPGTLAALDEAFTIVILMVLLPIMCCCCCCGLAVCWYVRGRRSSYVATATPVIGTPFVADAAAGAPETVGIVQGEVVSYGAGPSQQAR